MQVKRVTILCLFWQQKLSLAMPSIEGHMEPHGLYIVGGNVSGWFCKALPSKVEHSHTLGPTALLMGLEQAYPSGADMCL